MDTLRPLAKILNKQSLFFIEQAILSQSDIMQTSIQFKAYFRFLRNEHIFHNNFCQ